MPSDCSTADGRTAMNTALAPPGPPSTRLILLFAVACGSAVANVYFAQPLLVTLGERFALGPGLLGAIVAITQLGYAAGLFLLVPLGDLVDRRRLIPLQLGLLAAALLLAGLAPGTAALLTALAAVGALAVVAQTMVAAAAHLTAPAFRGRVVGAVTSGVITGILLARTVAGVVADLAGWRAVYLFSAVVTATLAVLLRLALPTDRPHAVTMPYRRLLASTVVLFARHPLLRVRGMLALLVFAAFSTLWSSVVQPLSSPPWSLTHTAIGAFGLAGAAGAAAAGAHAADGTTATSPSGPRVPHWSCSPRRGSPWPSPGSRSGPWPSERSSWTSPSRPCTSPTSPSSTPSTRTREAESSAATWSSTRPTAPSAPWAPPRRTRRPGGQPCPPWERHSAAQPCCCGRRPGAWTQWGDALNPTAAKRHMRYRQTNRTHVAPRQEERQPRRTASR